MNVVRQTRATGEPSLLRITAAQFSVMVEAGAFTGDLGVEPRGGLLYRLDPRHMPHLRAKSGLHEALLDALRSLKSPLRVASEGSVLLADDEVPRPDLIVWEPMRGRGPVPGGRVRLVVEVSDTTLADDPGRKRVLYAAASIPEYWVADPPGRAVHRCWAPAEGAYARSAVVPFGGTIRSATLAGLAVPTAAPDEGGEPRWPPFRPVTPPARPRPGSAAAAPLPAPRGRLRGPPAWSTTASRRGPRRSAAVPRPRALGA